MGSLGLTTFYYCQEYGANLSQGQKQIIIFLSLFFYDWKVILLDEILSNIIIKKIIIYAGHDLTLVKLFKNVIDLNNYKSIDGNE